MPVDVFAADEQADRPVDLERWAALARAVLADRGVKGDAEVSLLFVDQASIAALNERFLGGDGPTDVLAFPIEDEPAPGGRSPDLGGTGPGSESADEPLVLLGDVVVCPAVAARNAVEHGVTVDDETALLVVHGLLHLLGLDPGEGGVLGEEAVARVHGIGVGAPGDGDDLVNVQVGLRRGGPLEGVGLVGGPHVLGVEVLVGVDGDAGQAGVPAGTRHPDRDLAAIRD